MGDGQRRWMYFRTKTKLDIQRLKTWFHSVAAQPALNRVRAAKYPNGAPRTVRQDVEDMLRLCEKLNDDTLEQQYWRSIGSDGRACGRAYAVAMSSELSPVQAMPKEARALLLDAYQADVDMANASISFTADMLLECDNTAMAEGRYDTLFELAQPEKREAFLRRIIRHYELDKS